MPFDPWGIEDHHKQVRERIQHLEHGLAQSVVGDVMVSYEVGHSITHGPVLDLPLIAILDEMILDVARGEGVAGPKTFMKSAVRFAIENRRAYDPSWVKKHKEAEDIESFYFGGSGAAYLI